MDLGCKTKTTFCPVGGSPLTDLQPRPVELWLKSLSLSPKSKIHIRGLLSTLWDYAMWRGDVPTERNPMELVKVLNATKRVRKPRSLTVGQFHALLEVIGADVCWRTMLLVAVSFGLRISELLGLKWKDVDWLNKTIRIERGVVKQVVAILFESLPFDCHKPAFALTQNPCRSHFERNSEVTPTVGSADSPLQLVPKPKARLRTALSY
jgi:integrase